MSEQFPLNMTNEEKEAYETLLAFGQLTAGELSQFKTIKLEDATSLLQSLLNKGLACTVSTFSNHYLPKFPFLETHTHFKELTDRINAVDKQSKSFFDERNTDLTNYQTSKNDEIKQQVKNRIDEFNDRSSDLKEKINSTITELDNELQNLEKNFIDSVNAKAEEFKNTEKGKIEGKKTDFDKTVRENETKILGTVQTHKSQLESISNQFTSTIQDFSLNYLDEVYNKLKTLLNSLRDDLNNLSSQFDNDGKEWTKNSFDTQIAVFDDFSAVLDDNFGHFGLLLSSQNELTGKMTIDEDLPSTDNKLLGFIATVNNNFIEYKNKVSARLAEANNYYNEELGNMNTQINNFKTSSEEKIASLTSTYLQHLDENTNNYKETVSQTVTADRTDIETFSSKLNGEFQTLEKERNDSLAKIADDMKNQQEIARQTQKDATTHLQDGILTPFNTQFAEIKRIKKKFFNDTTKAVDTHYKTIDTKMKEILESFRTSYDGFTEKTQLKSDESMKGANKDFDIFIKNEQQLNTVFMNDLKKAIPGMQANVDKQVSELNAKISAELQTLDSAVSTQVDNTRKNMDNLQKLFVTDLMAELTKLIDTNNEEDQKVTKLVLLQKIKESIKKKLDIVDKDLKNSITELNTKILDPFKIQLTDLTTRKTNLVNSLSKSSTDHFANVNKHLDDLNSSLTTKTSDLNTKVAKSIESTFTKLKGDYKNFIKEQYKITEDHFKEQKKTLPTYQKDGIKLIKDINKIFSPELKRLETTVKTFTTSSFALLGSLDNVIITGIPDNLRDNIARTSAELSKNSSTVQTELATFKNTWLTSLQTMETSLHSFNATNKDQHTKEIENLKTESLQVLGDETTTSLTFNSNVHAYGNKHVQTEHDDFQALLVNALNTSKNGLLDIIHEQQAILTSTEEKKKTDFEAQNKTINDRYKGISDTLNEYISNFNNTTQERVNSRESEVTELHDETKSKITEETDKTNKNHLNEIGTTITTHETDYKNHHANLVSISHDFLQLIENDSKSFADMVRDDSTARMQENKNLTFEKTKYVRTIHDHFASSVATANQTATSLQDGLITSVGDHYNKLIAGNEGFTKDFQTTVTTGIEILTPKITIMEDFERIVNEFTFPRITSLPVIGSSSALHTISHYLSDFKASVTLLIPNPSDIPVELISKTKRPKRVTVASTFNLDNQREKDIVNKLIEQDNVTVRQLATSHTTESGYLQYLSADRDSEEIFFGAYDKENKAEFSGMVSQNRQYIEFIGRVITSDFLSKAKKIEKV